MTDKPTCIAGDDLVDDELFILDDRLADEETTVRIISNSRVASSGASGPGTELHTQTASSNRSDPRQCEAESIRGQVLVGTRHPWRAKGRVVVRRVSKGVGILAAMIVLGFVIRWGWGRFAAWQQARSEATSTPEATVNRSLVAAGLVPPAVGEASVDPAAQVPGGAGGQRKLPATAGQQAPDVADKPVSEAVPTSRDGAMSLAGEALSALIAGVEKHASPPPSGAASAGSVADLSPEDQALWSQYWGASVPCEGVTAGAAGAEEATVVDDVVDNAVDNASDGSVAQATAPGTGHLRVDGGENPDIDGQGVGPAEEPGEGETAADQPVEVTLPGGVSVLLYRDETIVELKNGHYFKGKIKNLDEHAITLFYDRGEYTFGMDELEQIVPPGSPEYLPLRHFPDAWVVLANGSRFRGRLIKDDTERIVVGYPSGRLTFRRADVAEVCYLARGDLVVVPDEGAFSK